MIIVDDFHQGSPQWDQERLGNPGASSFKRIVTTKCVRSESRIKYMRQLAGEIMTGKKSNGYSNKRMEDGLKFEQDSRALYEFIYGVEIRQVALCYKDEQKKYHCSPDGLMVDLEEGFETKDAIPEIQIERLLKDKLPSEHFTQCQGSMLVTGYPVWVFQSYSEGLKPLTIRVDRDEKFVNRLEAELDEFCFELAMMVKRLKEMV